MTWTRVNKNWCGEEIDVTALEKRAQEVVETEFLSFVESLREYPNYDAWLKEWELPRYE